MADPMSEKFTKRPEDFECLHCDLFVKGRGYTNHCPRCLWSRHVDIFPGDRKAACKGMMEPVAAEIEGLAYVIIHRCEKCGLERRNAAAPEDDFEEILKLIRKRRGKKR